MTLKIPVFLDVTLCRLAGSFWCSKGLYCLQKCPLLGYYIVSSGNFLPTFRNPSVPSSGIRNWKRRDIRQNILQSLQNSHGHTKEFLYRQFGHGPQTIGPQGIRCYDFAKTSKLLAIWHSITSQKANTEWSLWTFLLSFQIAHTVYAYFALLKQMHSPT